MNKMTKSYETVIIGAGPAGTTAAALMAEQGHNVCLLEKRPFPRYHVGESLIPYCYFTLNRLGMIEKLNESAFTKKYSVQFVSTEGKASQPFYFFKHKDHPSSTTYQVRRDEFDQMLLDNATDKGAVFYPETTARELIEEGGTVKGIIATDKDGNEIEFHAPMTIDATGLDTFTVKKKQWRVQDPELNKMAVWTYYKGAKRDEGMDEGATTVAYVPEKGWFWYIPLHDDMVSVGIVAEPSYLYRDGRDPQKMFEREINNNEWIREHLEVGTPTGEFHHTGDYSYRSKHCAMDGLILTGDAYAFLDPVFSSGVFLALKSGELAADAIHTALMKQDFTAAQFEPYAVTMKNGIEAMRRLVYAFYDESFTFKDLLMKYPEFREDLTDCLIGHVDKDFDPLFEKVAEFAKVPGPLPHGLPLVKEEKMAVA